MVRALLALLLVAVLGGGAFAAEPVKLVYWQYFTDSRSFIEEEIVRRFNEQNPLIQVELGELGGKNANSIMAHMAAGTQIDIGSFNRQLSWLMYEGHTVDLTPYIERDRFDLSIFRPGVLNAVTYGGGYRGLPFVTGGLFPYVNVDLVNEAGMAVPGRGWTMNDLDEFIVRLTRRNPDQSIAQWALGHNNEGIMALMLADGGSFFDERGDFVLHREPVVSRLEWVFNHIHAGGIRWGWQPWAQGQIAMKLDWEGRVPEHFAQGAHELFEFRIIHPPVGARGEFVVSAVNNLVILGNSRHPDEAWEFLKFFATEGDILFGENLVYPSTLPGARAVVENSDNVLPQGWDIWTFYQGVLDPPARGVNSPEWAPGFATVRNQLLYPAYNAVVAGEKAPLVALQEIAEQASAILADARRDALAPAYSLVD